MPTASPATLRDQAIAAFRRLPKNCSADDLHQRLYVLEKIRKSEAAVERSGAVTHAQAKRRVRKWLTSA